MVLPGKLYLWRTHPNGGLPYLSVFCMPALTCLALVAVA